jgi:hypothetical protein
VKAAVSWIDWNAVPQVAYAFQTVRRTPRYPLTSDDLGIGNAVETASIENTSFSHSAAHELFPGGMIVQRRAPVNLNLQDTSRQGSVWPSDVNRAAETAPRRKVRRWKDGMR